MLEEKIIDIAEVEIALHLAAITRTACVEGEK